MSSKKKNLATYELPALSNVPKGSVRVWEDNRWFRVVACHPQLKHAELPDLYRNMLLNNEFAKMNELFVTWDAASWDQSAANFLLSRKPMGMGLSFDAREDSFHADWNNFKWAAYKDPHHVHLTLTQMFLTVC